MRRWVLLICKTESLNHKFPYETILNALKLRCNFLLERVEDHRFI